jgi:hypothetical protein
VYWDIEAKLALSTLALPFRFGLKYGIKQERMLSGMESSRSTFGKKYFLLKLKYLNEGQQCFVYVFG